MFERDTSKTKKNIFSLMNNFQLIGINQQRKKLALFCETIAELLAKL